MYTVGGDGVGQQSCAKIGERLRKVNMMLQPPQVAASVFGYSELMFYEIHTCIFSSGLIALVCLSASKPAIRRYEAGPPENVT